MQLKTILGNVGGVLVGGWLVTTLAPHIELVDIYSKAAYPAQVLMAFAGILISFAFIIWLKETALRNQLHHATAAKTIFYPAAVIFLLIDVLFNICYSPLFLLGSTANSHDEGWTFTSHCKAVRDDHIERLESGGLTRIEW
jgi:hypothetical protein